ncbi:MAG TPA: TIGR02281 family clan AA aspartic protease [Rhizomicrobium sp.]|jgi:aspartyl protease family protein|nr:TIGR02281 family clan AA aspartic protease [Rhizomicrobium sp.]
MSQPGPWGHARGPRKPSRTGLYLWLGLIGGAGLAVFLLNQAFPSTDTVLGDPALVQTLGFLALASSGLLFVRQFHLKQTARNVLIWVAVGGVLIIGFSFQNELKDLGLQLRSALVPGYPVQTGPHELTLSEGEDGHFHVYGTINGTRIAFLVDTGASDIVLDPADARRLGIDLDTLTFDRPFGSANGIGYGAKTVVAGLVVGPIVFSDVEVSINKARMGSSLLGMAFLKRLKSYSVSGGKLILRW